MYAAKRTARGTTHFPADLSHPASVELTTEAAVVHPAIGILRSRSGGSTDDAFETLTKMSNAAGRSLMLTASELVDEAVRRAPSVAPVT